MEKLKHISVSLLILIIGSSITFAIMQMLNIEKIGILWGILIGAVVGPVEILAINKINISWFKYLKLDGDAFPFFCLGVVASLTIF